MKGMSKSIYSMVREISITSKESLLVLQTVICKKTMRKSKNHKIDSRSNLAITLKINNLANPL